MTFLHIVDRCDNFRLDQNKEVLAKFYVAENFRSAIGLLRPEVLEALYKDNEENRSTISGQKPWMISNKAGGGVEVSFHNSIDTTEKRSAVIKRLCERWRDAGLFPDLIGGHQWRNELYSVYINPFGPRGSSNHAFDIERAASALFGIVTYGVHMTIYHPPSSPTDEISVWVPRRALTKQTWPGYLDNSVAGGVPSGMPIFECLVKESMEEASIEDNHVRNCAKCVGSVSYFFQTVKGWLQPEIEFVYDLYVPSEAGKPLFLPKPLDGEVESFELLPLSVVIEKMHEKLFKPNCALVLLDFLIRHGCVTPDNEPHYMEIITRLHGRFEHDRW